jgi:hypothetical protein
MHAIHVNKKKLMIKKKVSEICGPKQELYRPISSIIKCLQVCCVANRWEMRSLERLLNNAEQK